MEDLITVIVPVYKVEKYIRRCIESIINQTYRNLEIILVDDGSPDDCGKICDEYAKKDNRIKVIHKENGGLSDARNKALDLANGKYVIFVDSDDYIEKNAIGYLYKLIQKYNTDIAIGLVNSIYDGEKNSILKNKESNIKVYNKEQALETMLYNTEFTNMACNKHYKK